MSTRHKIFPELNLNVTVRSGFVRSDEMVDLARIYMADPLFSPGQHQLVHLGGVTGFDRDYVTFMKQQALICSAMTRQALSIMVVMFSRPGPGRDVAMAFSRSWEDLSQIVVRQSDSLAEAASMLGLPETFDLQMLDRVA